MATTARADAPSHIPWRGTAIVLFFALSACGGGGSASHAPETKVLRIGFGLVGGTTVETGIRQTTRNIASDTVLGVRHDGRAQPSLAESWSVSPDGLVWRIHLRPAVKFHDGTPADAEAIRKILAVRLPEELGPAFADVANLKAAGNDVEITLRARSTFLMEALTGIAILKPEFEAVGTGPFRVVNRSGDRVEMSANAEYYGGKPTIERIVITPYTSVRAAWADLLRGQVDMVYDVGVDALDSLKSSNDVKVYAFQSRYAYLLLLNMRRPGLQDPAFRRELNTAIDRNAFIAEALNSHGTPAEGAWPHHWAYSASLPHFSYQPPSTHDKSTRRHFKILFGEPLLERLALVVQRQLQAIGVDAELEQVAGDQVESRIRAGDFDAVLSDYIQGPNMLRPSLNWHTAGPRNYGHYSSPAVDSALEAIRHAADDTAYKNGVAAYQRAMIEDPPAVFLSWRERDRAVSRRFVVPAEPDTDVLLALHLWRPASNETTRNQN